MSDDQSKDAEALLQQSKEQKRHNAQPSGQPAGEVSLEAEIVQAYRDLDDGELVENLTVRDENLAALFAGLEATGGLSEIGGRANEWLGRDESVGTRAGLLKALIRVGLAEVAGEEVSDAKSARRLYIAERESESDF